jgi:hypothetical protein
MRETAWNIFEKHKIFLLITSQISSLFLWFKVLFYLFVMLVGYMCSNVLLGYIWLCDMEGVGCLYN